MTRRYRTGLTADELRRALHYDPATGIFTRRIASSWAKVGDIAGGLDHNGYRQIFTVGCSKRIGLHGFT